MGTLASILVRVETLFGCLQEEDTSFGLSGSPDVVPRSLLSPGPLGTRGNTVPSVAPSGLQEAGGGTGQRIPYVAGPRDAPNPWRVLSSPP